MSAYNTYSEQELINYFCGTTGLSIQEALNTYFNNRPFTGGYSDQEAMSLKKRQYPLTEKNLHEHIFNTWAKKLSITDGISNHSLQELLTRLRDAGYTGARVFYPAVSAGDSITVTDVSSQHTH